MPRQRSQLWLFFTAVICMGAALGAYETVFNNFLSDTFDMAADARGYLEFPRELPGLLVVMMAGALSALAVTHLGVVGALVFVAGMVGMALWGGISYGVMIVFMMIISAGMHLLQPVRSSIALSQVLTSGVYLWFRGFSPPLSHGHMPSAP